MLLTKSRVSVVATGIILLLGLALLMGAGLASANDAAGAIPGAFGDNVAARELAVGGPVDWRWTNQGAEVKVDVFLSAQWANMVYGVEVFIDPTAPGAATAFKEHKPVFVATMPDPSTPFPTGRTVTFVFTSARRITAASVFGIHLNDRGAAANSVLISEGAAKNVALKAPTLLTTANALVLPSEEEEAAAAAPPAEGAPQPPPTGDYAPSGATVLAIAVAGLLLIIGGRAYLVQGRRARS